MNKYQEARCYYLQAAKINKHVFKKDHLNKAYTLSNLGELYQKQHQYKKAECYFHKALEMKQRLYNNTDNPEIANELKGIASFHFQKENYTKAKEFYNKALNIYKYILIADHPSIIHVKSKLEELTFRMTKS